MTMRTLPLSSLLLCLACAVPAEDVVPKPAPAPAPVTVPSPTATTPPATTPAPATPVATPTTTPPVAETTPPPVPVVIEPRPDGRFMLEFRGARLGQVLDYLSAVAGYVIANPVE